MERTQQLQILTYLTDPERPTGRAPKRTVHGATSFGPGVPTITKPVAIPSRLAINFKYPLIPIAPSQRYTHRCVKWRLWCLS